MQNVNIRAVSLATGINENTLRAWERRYQVVEPSRAADGRRLYSRQDIEKIGLLWNLVQRGHLISQLAPLSVSQLRKLCAELSPNSEPVAAAEASESVSAMRLKDIISALQKFDLAALQRELNSVRFELSPKVTITQLILPLLSEVGERVADGTLSVAQEHLLSSLLRDYLGGLYQTLSPYEYLDKSASMRVMLTTREGDLHEFGILLAAILCRIRGHETYYLGPNMPAKDLAHACERFKVKLLLVGLNKLPPEKELITAGQFLRQLDKLAPTRMTIAWGGEGEFNESLFTSGRPFLQFPSMDELDAYLLRHK